MLPHAPYWEELAALVTDGVRLVTGRGAQRGYSSLQSTEGGAPNNNVKEKKEKREKEKRASKKGAIFKPPRRFITAGSAASQCGPHCERDDRCGGFRFQARRRTRGRRRSAHPRALCTSTMSRKPSWQRPPPNPKR